MQLAFKFMMGNHALRNSRSKVYKLCRKIECAMITTRLIKDNPSEKNKPDSKFGMVKLVMNQWKYSPFRRMLHMKLAIMAWREYSKLKEEFKSEEFRKKHPGMVDDVEKCIEDQKDAENTYFSEKFPMYSKHLGPSRMSSPHSPNRNSKLAKLIATIMEQQGGKILDLIVIDHHKTLFNYLNRIKPVPLSGDIDMDEVLLQNF